VGQAEDEQTEEEFFHKKAYEEIKRVFCFLRLVCGTVLRVNHFQTQKNGHPLNFYKCWASPKPVETLGHFYKGWASPKPVVAFGIFCKIAFYEGIFTAPPARSEAAYASLSHLLTSHSLTSIFSV
jgi:hypothetical protein